MRSRCRRCGSLPARPTSKAAGEAESARPTCCFWTQSWGGGEFRLATHILSIVWFVGSIVLVRYCRNPGSSLSQTFSSVSTFMNQNSYTSRLVSWCLITVSHNLLPIYFSAPAGWTLEQRGEGGGPPAAGNGHMHKRKCNLVSEWHDQVIEWYKCDFSGDQIWEKCLGSTRELTNILSLLRENKLFPG